MNAPKEEPTPVYQPPKDDGSNNDGRVFGREWQTKPCPKKN